MTKNITLRMDEKDLKNLKHVAIEHDMSVSAWITKAALDAAKKEEKAEIEGKKRQYEQAKSVVFKAMEEAVDYGDGGKTFNRDALHER